MIKENLEQQIVARIRGTIRIGGLVTGLAGTIGAIGAGIYHGQTGQPLIDTVDGTHAVLTAAATGLVSAVLLSVSDPKDYAGIPDYQCYPVPQLDLEEWGHRITLDETLSSAVAGGFMGALCYGVGYGVGKLFQ